MVILAGFLLMSYNRGESLAGAPFTTTSSTPKTSDPIADTCSATDQFTFTDIGVAMDATIMGVETGSSIADSTAVVLPDGRVRMYFQYLAKDRSQGAHYSAISSDGVTFTMESGARLGDPEWMTEEWGPHIKAKWLSDGRLRIYKGAGDTGIISYVSSDGLAFTKEDGVRITTNAAGLARLSHLTITTTLDGNYRGYFSNMPQGSDSYRLVKSATSADLLTWTMDSGVRIGEGSVTLPDDSAEQPHALQRAGGGVTLFFYRTHYKGEIAVPPLAYYSTSTDGVTFTNVYSLGLDGNGPDIVRLNDGTYLLYYDVGNETQGFSIRVGKLGLTPSVAITADHSTYRAGDRIVVTVATVPGSSSVTVDAYAAIQLPDGRLFFLQGDGSLTGATQPIIRSWPVDSSTGQIFSYTFGGGEPVGNYAWLAAFTEAGTLNLIGSINSAPFSFTP